MSPKAMYSPQNKESLNLNHNGKLTKYREATFSGVASHKG